MPSITVKTNEGTFTAEFDESGLDSYMEKFFGLLELGGWHREVIRGWLVEYAEEIEFETKEKSLG